MHKKRSENNFLYKCLKPNCKSTFVRKELLDVHMRIHNNQVDYCQYCPYRYVEPAQYKNHLKKHFQIKDNTCDHCGLSFTTKKDLNDHASRHEGIIYSCTICDAYEIERKNSMQMHLRMKHSDILGPNINWETVKKYVKLK